MTTKPQNWQLFVLYSWTQTSTAHAYPIVNELIKQRDKVIDILSTKATSRPKARKLNGGTKKRNRFGAASAESKLPI